MTNLGTTHSRSLYLETGGVLDGGPVDPDVGEDHDAEGAEEGDGRREHQVHRVLREWALERRSKVKEGDREREQILIKIKAPSG